MNEEGPLILIADDSEISREYIANILIPAGYRVIQAIDGGSAFKVVQEHNVSLAIIDHYMAPYGGLEFARGLRLNDIHIPMVMVTNEETSDLLVEITRNGISSYLKKPAEPARLLETVKRALRELKITRPEAENNGNLGSATIKTAFSHEELMQKALELAENNVKSGNGGPFGAIIADKDGKIVGEGTNRTTFRADPIAHAEVMAIRQATQKLDTTNLDECVLYLSSEPTRVGKALIDSVGILQVYYGLSSQDIATFYPSRSYPSVKYEQMQKDAALKMMSAAKTHNDK